jgi:hypothetical protein
MTSHPWLRRCWVEFLQIVTNARTADALSLAACDHCATVLSSYGGSVTGSFETLEDIRRNRSNVAARCGSCDHRGVVDGGVLWRWFALHRWKSRPTDLVEHMRCSICRRRPVELEATSESPTIEFGPRDEIGWQEVVTRLRSAPPRQPDW